MQENLRESEYKEYLHLTAAMAAQTPQNTSAMNKDNLFIALIFSYFNLYTGY